MEKQSPTVGIVRHQQFLPSETFIASQAQALRAFQPLFVARDPVPALSSLESVSVSEFGKVALLTYTATRRSQALRDALAERRVALLHAHFGVEGVYAAWMARKLGVPLVTTLHGFDVTVTKAKLIASRKPSWVNYVAWRKALFRECAIFVCVSEHIRRRAVEWGYPPDRLVVVPIGVDVDMIRPTEFVETPRVIHIARLVGKKGTAYLLHAFAIVKAQLPEAELVIIGDGPLRNALGELAQQLGVTSSVRFLGARKHKSTLSWLRQSRILCLPSVTDANGDQEGLGMVLLEAAAAGKAVVGTAHGGIPEAVTDGTTGFLVQERDVQGLANRLLELLRDRQLCEQLGNAGREMVVDRFNLHRQTAKLESLYRNVT